MSPEVNGNPPPVVKRKKKRLSKSAPHPDVGELNGPSLTYFQNNLNPLSNLTIKEATCHPFSNYSSLSEPLSLPVYPNRYGTCLFHGNSTPNYPANVPCYMSSTSTGSKEYVSLPMVNADQTDNVQRRFSDPGPNESDSSCNSLDGKIIQKLSHQVSALKECNRKLTREVGELKVELNVLKQQYGSGHYERDYEPGILAEFIKELRDASRVREDALIAKIKHIIEEKQLSMVSVLYISLVKYFKIILLSLDENYGVV